MRHSPVKCSVRKTCRYQSVLPTYIWPTIQLLLAAHKRAECMILYDVIKTSQICWPMFTIQSNTANTSAEREQSSGMDVSYIFFHQEACLDLLQLKSLAHSFEANEPAISTLSILIDTVNWLVPFGHRIYLRLTSQTSCSTIAYSRRGSEISYYLTAPNILSEKFLFNCPTILSLKNNDFCVPSAD